MEEQPSKRISTFPLFSKHFNSHPRDVVDFLKQMSQQMEDFVEAFRKRIEIEVCYSNDLQDLSKFMDKHIKPETDLSTSYICSAFKVEHQRRSRQSLELAQSLKSQIEQICATYLKLQTDAYKKVEKQVKRYYQDARICTENHKKSLQALQTVNRQMEESLISKNIAKYATGISNEKKLKVQKKLSKNTVQQKDIQKNYQESVKTFNKFAVNYNNQIGKHLDEVENIIRQQIILQGDCLRKLIISQIGMFKNIQYDLLNICKQMQVLDPQRNVQAFTEQYKTSNKSLILSEQKKENKKDNFNFPLPQKQVIGKMMLSESIYYVEKGYFAWMVSNHNNRQLRDLVQKIWKSNKINSKNFEQKNEIKDLSENKSIQIIENWQSELQQAISQLKIINPPHLNNPDKNGEKGPNHQKINQKFVEIIKIISNLWNAEPNNNEKQNQMLNILSSNLQSHHLYRLAALMFLEQYRQQNELTIRASNKLSAKIIRVIIKQSQNKNDVFIIRGILALIFTFYWNQDKVRKHINLIPQVYQCEIWKKNDFWDAAIFETTYNESTKFQVKKGQSQIQTSLREKNIIFNQLASYCNYMVMLGVTPKHVRLIVGKYCRLYDLSEQHNKQLSKMINDSQKQFKQYWRYSLKSEKKEQN